MTAIKFGIVSDLHTEFWYERHYADVGQRVQALAEADIILLAGDIGSGGDSVRNARRLFPDTPVCLVAGNHEFYDSDHDTVLAELRAAAVDSNVAFLDRDVFETVIHDRPVRILGATLWTDFALFGTPSLSMILGQRGLNDFRLIRHQGRRIVAQDTVDWHQTDRDWLFETLALPFDGTTVVMTHHAPVTFAIQERFVGDALSPCFASQLDNLLVRDDLDLVVWGHTHHSVDRTIEGTRFISNQTGYVASGRTGVVETGCFGVVISV